jgi:hypothetical protein
MEQVKSANYKANNSIERLLDEFKEFEYGVRLLIIYIEDRNLWRGGIIPFAPIILSYANYSILFFFHTLATKCFC